MTEPTIHAVRASQLITMSQEMADDSQLLGGKSVFEVFFEQRRAWEALPQAERDRITAQRRLDQEIARAARTCRHCGCDPDEHGGY